MKAILLAGGNGTRLYPSTISVSKQLLPVYDKPLIYYPLSVLMLAGIRDILIITNRHNLPNFKKLLSDGNNLGIKITYKIQDKPNGIAESLIIGEKFIKNDSVCLILGDNIFYGNNLINYLKEASMNSHEHATIFGYQVSNPKDYGVISFDKKNLPIKIEEKPKKPKSNLAITGLYFYPPNVSNVAKKTPYSKRKELEITSVNNYYLKKKKLKIINMGRGFAWLDTGTHSNLMEASSFIYAIEKRQDLKIGCIEEIALNQGFISQKKFNSLVSSIKIDNQYYSYLKKLIKK